MTVANDIPLGYTYDTAGRVLSYRDVNGFWHTYTYNANGYAIAYKNSSGSWYKRTFDANGNEFSYENEDGHSIAYDGQYFLQHNPVTDRFTAGCHWNLTRAEALAHWNRSDDRARLFTDAIMLTPVKPS